MLSTAQAAVAIMKVPNITGRRPLLRRKRSPPASDNSISLNVKAGHGQYSSPLSPAVMTVLFAAYAEVRTCCAPSPPS
jgi:hypothetical protein